MATVVLNIATELSSEYDNRNIEVSLLNVIQTKGDLTMKYARELNNTGSWFVDIVECPTSVTMSWSTAKTTGFSTDIHFASDIIYCEGTHDWNSVIFYFNTDYDDLWYANYQWSQVAMSATQQTGTFSDLDTTFIDVSASYPLGSDGIDDNFDSDEYTFFSTWSVQYPDGYADNDDDARLLNYGYVLEGAGLYSMFWSNREMQEYIDENTHNSDGINVKLWDVSSGRLYLDINKSFRLILYRIDDAQYELTKEFISEEKVTWTWQVASIGYLQDDLSLSPAVTGSEYDFDFVNNDYALFVENTSSGALLYRIRGEEIGTGSWVYLSPLKDDDSSIFWYLWNHILISEDWYLVGEQYEVFGLK